MWGILTLFSVGYIIYGLTKEKLEKPAPKGQRFDWDAYWEDVGNGISAEEQLRKRKRGGYYTTEPKKPDWWELPMDTVVDVKRYEYDKIHAPYLADLNRKTGRYRKIEPINYELPGTKVNKK